MLDIYVRTPRTGLRCDARREELPLLLRDDDAWIWVDLFDPTPDEQRVLTDVFGFHPLEVEDCQSLHEPKIDEFEDHLFILFHGIAVETTLADFVTRQIAFFLGRRYLVTYHVHDSRSIRNAKDACRKNPAKLAAGVDGLLHTILDYAVDMYLPIIDQFEKAIDRVEEKVFNDPKDSVITEVDSQQSTVNS